MTPAAALAAALFFPAASWAQDAAVSSAAAEGPPDFSDSTGTVELAFFRCAQHSLEMPLLSPFERVLREDKGLAGPGTGLLLLGAQTLASHYDGRTYMLRIPPGFLSGAGGGTAAPGPPPSEGGGAPLPQGAGVSSAAVRVLEAPEGALALFPEDGALLDRLGALAEDPSSYDPPRQVRLRRTSGLMSWTSLDDGAAVVSLRLDAQDAGAWRNGLALLFEVRTQGRVVHAVFFLRASGGEGRLAAALNSLRRRHGARLLALSRGDIFPIEGGAVQGTSPALRMDALGVRAAAVSLGELTRWPQLEGYLRENPEGMKFLSANLVHASSPSVTVFPPWAVFRVDGVRVGVLGLTRREWGRFLDAERMRTVRIEDPVAAARRRVGELRKEADLVIALGNLTPEENAQLRRRVRGIDIIAGESIPFSEGDAGQAIEARDLERGAFGQALLVEKDWFDVLTTVRTRRIGTGGGSGLSLRQEHLFLSDELLPEKGFGDFDASESGVIEQAEPPLLPSARRLLPGPGLPEIEPRAFWSLAASMAADALDAEAAVLPVQPVHSWTMGDFSEAMVREWFPWEDRLVVFELPGSALKALTAAVRGQETREKKGLPRPEELLRITYGGLGREEKIHGSPIDPSAVYKVAGTESLLARAAEFPALAEARNAEPAGSLKETVVGRLKDCAREGWRPERYRPLLEGRPVRERALWRIHFRDVGVNASDTKVVRDPAFSRVPNSRIQGFDQLLLGGAAKVGAELLSGPWKWSNGVELEYSRSRLRTPAGVELVNIPTNRLSLLSAGTLRLASFPWRWLAHSVGPSLGLQYEGELEKTPGLRRKQVYSLYPGVELFGGTLLRSVELSANLKRDLSRDSADNQYGLRGRILLSKPLGAGTLAGELWTNYFVLTRRDSPQDLRVEGNAQVQVRFPLYRQLTLAPFIDFYFFSLKTRPLTGYSAITGLSLGFSRIWKPQYERF